MSINTLNREEIIRLVAAGFHNLGDVYTDAKEMAPEVKEAKNLEIVATRLCGEPKAVAVGTLIADGQEVCAASVDIAGRLIFDQGDDTPHLGSWDELKLQLTHNDRTWDIPVTAFPALTMCDEDRYVLADVNVLLDVLLGLV